MAFWHLRISRGFSKEKNIMSTNQRSGKILEMMIQRWQKRGAVLALLTVWMLGLAGLASLPAQENIALNRPYTFSRIPNYPMCTDPGDTTQLTDGNYAPSGNSQSGTETPSIWTMMPTVGWSGTKTVIITIDLGKSQPIGGLAFSTAASSGAAVEWPKKLMIFVSDDETNWRYVGDLVAMSALDVPPKIGRHVFDVNNLNVKGQFVSVALVPGSDYACCDEIEVYLGSGSTSMEEAETTDDLREFIAGKLEEEGGDPASDGQTP